MDKRNINLTDFLAISIVSFACIIWASSAVAFELTMATNGTLVHLSRITAGLSIFLLFSLCIYCWKSSFKLSNLDRGSVKRTGSLCILMLIGALLSSFSQRPDADDSYYMPNVTYAISHPTASITEEIRGLDPAPLETITSKYFATASAYDYLAATIYYWTNISHLTVRYLVLSALAGAALVGSIFLLLRQLIRDESECLAATCLIIGLLVIWRFTHRTYGNFAFVRLFQSKAVAMIVGLPLFAVACLSFLRAPRMFNAMSIFLIVIALCGMTVTITPLLIATGIGIFGGLLAARPYDWRLLFYRSLFIIPLMIGIVLPLIKVFSSAPLNGANNPANIGWPTTFWGHAQFIGMSTLLILAVALILLLTNRSSEGKIIVLGWSATIMLFFLNPFAGDLLIQYAVGPNIYWRFFYALPWVPLMGIAFITLFDRWIKVLYPKIMLVAVAFLISAVIAGNIRWQNTLSFSPRWKLNASDVEDAQNIIVNSQPGTMLAPNPIAKTIPILNGERPQIVLRGFGLQTWALLAGAPQIAERRLKTVALLGGQIPQLHGEEQNQVREQFLQVLMELMPSSVVVRKLKNNNLSCIYEILRLQNYALTSQYHGYEIWHPSKGGEF